MNTVLWFVQGLLGIVFLMTGFIKISQPREKLKEKAGDWVEDFSNSQMKQIGVVELLGAIGIVAPMALNILPVFTPLAALGLVLDMAVAAMTHRKRKENKLIVTNIILLLLAAFVVLGRLVFIPVI